MRVSMTPIVPRKRLFDYRDYEREIRDAISDTGDVFVGALEKVVENWDHQPEFKKRITVGSNGVAVDVFATGENAQIFKWVDEGTKRHWVAPKKAQALAFNTGYVPRTTPGRGYGGPGRATGPVAFSKGHYVSGIEPRHFVKTVLEDNRDVLKDEIRDAIREAQR